MMLLKKICVVATLAFVVACAPNPSSPNLQNKPEIASASLKKQWKLIQFQSFNQQDLSQAILDLRELPRAHATVGCNQMSFQAAVQHHSWSVNHIAMTRMHCHDVAKLEFAFAQNIQAAKTYRLENNYLILQTPSGDIMKFVAMP